MKKYNKLTIIILFKFIFNKIQLVFITISINLIFFKKIIGLQRHVTFTIDFLIVITTIKIIGHLLIV